MSDHDHDLALAKVDAFRAGKMHERKRLWRLVAEVIDIVMEAEDSDDAQTIRRMVDSRCMTRLAAADQARHESEEK